MIARFHHRGWHYVLLIGLGGLMFFVNLGGPSLWDVDEGRNSECSYEMMQAGNWIVPTFNSRLRVDKPVLLYWLQILSYSCFGVNEFAARFPSALAALGTVLLGYELARSMFARRRRPDFKSGPQHDPIARRSRPDFKSGPQHQPSAKTTGLLTGVIVATMPMVCVAAHFANPDALLNFLTALTLTIFWLGVARRPWWWFSLIGCASGLAVLAKGPVGLVLPGAIASLLLIWERRLGVMWDRRWFLAFWSFVFTALPWYIWVGVETKGEFLVGFLWTHNVERGLSAMETHNGFPGYYLVVLICGMAPWSIFIGAACWFGFWSSIRNPWPFAARWWADASEMGGAESTSDSSDHTAAYRLMWCWIVVYLVFFSMAATKLPNYVLPAVLPCTVLLARFLQRWRTQSVAMPGWLVASGVLSLLLFGVGVLVGVGILGGVGELSALRGRYVHGLDRWALLGLAPILAAAACWWFARGRQYTRLVAAVAVSACLLLAPFAAFGSAVFNRYKAPRALVEIADAARQDEDIRIGCYQVEHLPSLNFYVKRNIEYFGSDNGLVNFLNARLRVYLFMPLWDWEQLQARLPRCARVVGRHYDMYHHADVVVVTNR